MKNKTYRSAQGMQVDVDMLRLRNEETIAVGNMRVNARGDELGPGGVVVKTRNEAMDEYYKSNAVYTNESAADAERSDSKPKAQADVEHDDISDLDSDIMAQDAAMPPVAGQAPQPKLRGSLADAVAKSATVEQKLLTPKKPLQRF
jgi:hypothetical protein